MFAILTSALDTLPQAERRVAEFINRNPSPALFMTTRELAAMVGVSEGSVVRLAQRLGFKGFVDFKLRLALDYEQRPSLYDETAQEPGIQPAVRRLFAAYVQCLQETLEVLSPTALERAVDAIDHASRVFVFGVGSSGFVALDAAHKLLRIGIAAWGFNDPHIQLAVASTIGPSSVAIGISHSGMTRDTIEPLKLAHDAHATTIAITNRSHSPIAMHADILLQTAAMEPVLRSGSLAARIAQLSVIDAITVGLHLRRKIQVDELLLQTSSAVMEKKTGEEEPSHA